METKLCTSKYGSYNPQKGLLSFLWNRVLDIPYVTSNWVAKC